MSSGSRVRSSARAALQIERYHTWPTIRRQTNGDHTCQLLRIYCQIFGPPPPDVTVYIVSHDMDELLTGDLPFEFGRDHPELKRSLSVATAGFVEGIFPPRRVAKSLDQLQLARVKICDLIEMFEFGLDEERMGNRHGTPIVQNTHAMVIKWLSMLSEDEQRSVERYIQETDQ